MDSNPERVAPLTVFKTAGFNHSPIPPVAILTDENRYLTCTVTDSDFVSPFAFVAVIVYFVVALGAISTQ